MPFNEPTYLLEELEWLKAVIESDLDKQAARFSFRGGKKAVVPERQRGGRTGREVELLEDLDRDRMPWVPAIGAPAREATSWSVDVWPWQRF